MKPPLPAILNCAALAQLHTSLAPQSKGNDDVGNGNGNKVAGDKAGIGEGSKSNDDSDKGGG